MSGCGARTATRSLDAILESSDVERFGWIGSWSSRYILPWIAKIRSDAASQSQAGTACAMRHAHKIDARQRLSTFSRSITFKVEKLRGSSAATAFLRKGTTQ